MGQSTKPQLNMRVSPEAWKLLTKVASHHGITKVAAFEMLVREAARSLKILK